MRKTGYETTEKTVRRVMRRFGLSADLTYIKLPGGNVYLMAIIDWLSRKVLGWRVFNTMDAIQYADFLRETIGEYGIEISMDGRNRALDNIKTLKELKAGIDAYFNFYNTERFHQSLDYNVPDEMYKCFQYEKQETKKAA